jgi:hypothetical protein
VEAKMLKAGATVLTVSMTLNLVLATGILVATVFLDKNPPILHVSLDEPQIARLDGSVLTTFKSLAIYFNGAVATSCLLSLFVIWMGLVPGQRWAFSALLLTIGTSQASAFVADSFIGNRTVPVNVVFAITHAVGLALCWFGLRGT